MGISLVCRFEFEGEVGYGVVEGDEVIEVPPGRMGRRPLGEVKILAPVSPSKVICLGYNYLEHAKEKDLEAPPKPPVLFLKAQTAVAGPGEPIVLPRFCTDVRCEGELAVVIGRKARHVRADEALKYVYGYTCANDVSDKVIQHSEGQWMRSKSFDTFAPVGPFIAVGDVDPGSLRILTRVNGVVHQDVETRLMVLGVEELVSRISSVMTLLPGDLILTGTGTNAPRVEHGDLVEVEIDGIGTLSNPVVRARE